MRYPCLRKMLAGAMMASAVVTFAAGASSALADDAGLMTGSVASADMGAVTVSEPAGFHQVLPLASGKSKVITLPRDARDILVSDPAVANAVIRTPQQIYITGLKDGQTNIIIFDRAGRQIVTLDVSVEKGGIDLQNLIHRLLPTSNIAVDVLNGNVVLSGSVDNAADAKQAVQLAAAFVDSAANNGQALTTPTAGGSSLTLLATTGSGDQNKNTGADRVINMLSVAGEDQVHLKVTVAEVQRNIAKQLGIDLSGSISIGSFGASFLTDNPFSVAGKAITNSFAKGGVTAGNNSLTATLQALDQTGMVRTLAEPTLTAISGESANFLAGGEFPVPTGRDQDGNITITYKPFGVSLSFTPIVLSEGRISLHVKTEVSELSSENAVQLSGLTLPSIVVRRSESVLELPSGGAMVMGGLLQDNIRQTINAIPALGKLPILGPLFRSRDFKRNETELVIIVTPYLVKPVARNQLARPDDGFATSSDRDADLLGRINRVYGGKGQPVPSGSYNGKYGFIYQ
ncbi:MAG: type II and III secretion system protein family protein [Rhizobiales bacterium]|nr:type II and III secretion system protein family protein [Hyphomicrobiales bacterium]